MATKKRAAKKAAKVTPRIITVAMLRRKHACDIQVEAFRNMFGTKTEVTPATCRKAAQHLNFGWAIMNLLRGEIGKRALAHHHERRDKYYSRANVLQGMYEKMRLADALAFCRAFNAA